MLIISVVCVVFVNNFDFHARSRREMLVIRTWRTGGVVGVERASRKIRIGRVEDVRVGDSVVLDRIGPILLVRLSHAHYTRDRVALVKYAQVGFVV